MLETVQVLKYSINIVEKYFLCVGIPSNHIQYSVAVKIDLYTSGNAIKQHLETQSLFQVSLAYSKTYMSDLTPFITGCKTMRDVESGSWNVTPSRKRKIENNQDTPTNTPSPTTFSLKKKFKKAEDTSSEFDFMPVAQEAEKATSLLKRRQFCMRLADKILAGKVSETINDIKVNHLSPDQLMDATVVRYSDIFDETNTKAQSQHVNTHDLFFGDKNDIRQLVEMEGRENAVCVLNSAMILLFVS